MLLDVFEGHGVRHDEAFLEVCVDHSRSLGGFGACAHAPRLDLARTAREETIHAQCGGPRLDDFRKGALDLVLLAERCLLLRGHGGELGLEGAGHGDHLATPRFVEVLLNLGEPLVLLLDEVLLAHVQQEDQRLGRQELQRVQNLDIEAVPVALAHILARRQQILHLVHQIQLLVFWGARLSALLLYFLLGGLEALLDELRVLGAKLVRDHFHIPHRVDFVVDVDDVSILEDAEDVEDAVSRLDVAQERVTQSGALSRSFDQPGNVGHLEVRRDLAVGLVMLAQPIEPLIWDIDTRNRRVDRAEGVVFRRHRH
mmetsp:Transcript_606/g.1392  ORF Transcript_606/g.1392 Transcript_606/m.1392 type:complete len:313 (-) Transcript_606:208-1146(-)